jgi:plasmid stabilization system protein ParE
MTTFALLATQPNIGWHPHLRRADLKSLRVFRVKTFERVLVLYLPLRDGVEILRLVHGSRDLQALLRREGLD